MRKGSQVATWSFVIIRLDSLMDRAIFSILTLTHNDVDIRMSGAIRLI
jgi:hypothetical protein